MTKRSFERIGNATRLLLQVQLRSGFLHVYFGLALASVVVVRWLLPESWALVVVPAMLLGEYGTMGLYLVAAQRLLEKNEKSASALAVTPLESWEQVTAMIVAPGLVATTAGVLLFAGSLGLDARTLFLLPPLACTTLLAGAGGVILSSYYSDFTRFLLASIPVVTLFQLPFLSFFSLTPRLSFAWLPWDAALFSFANLASTEAKLLPYVLLLLELAVFAALGIWWSARVYRDRVWLASEL
jgi:hypothetical protein